MNLTSLSKLPLSSMEGWPELEKIHPDLLKLLAFVILPLSLLPPGMLYYAGTHYPELFFSWAAGRDWTRVSAVFFLAEMATLCGMGWLIKQVAETDSLRMDYHDAYMLAGIAPVPLWLASLGLLVPSMAFNAVLSLVALGLSCGIIYHGIKGLCHMREDVTAASIVQTVIGAGLAAWALLMMIAVML